MINQIYSLTPPEPREDRAREVAQLHAILLLRRMLPRDLEEIEQAMPVITKVASNLLPFLLGIDALGDPGD